MGIALSGLSSGIDTNSIISQLVALEREPITRLERREAVENARKTAYNDIKAKLTDFRSAVQGLRDLTLFSPTQKVTTSDEALLGVTRTAGGAAGGYSVTITQMARAEQWKASAAFTAVAADDTLTITVGGSSVNVALTAGDDVDDIAQKINNTAGTGAYATVIDGQLYLSGRKTGASQTITVTSTGSTAADLGFGGGAAVKTQAAANADITVNGTRHTSYESNTIEGLIAGVKLNLKAVGTAGVTITEPAVDEEALTAKIQKFVDAYNAVLREIDKKVSEKPLKRDEIKNNVDAVKGALYNDSTLTGLASRLRVEVVRMVSGLDAANNSWADLGVDVAKASETTTADAKLGILNLDKDKFLAAFNANPDQVKAFLNNATGDANTEGMAQYFERAITTPYLQFDTGIFDTAAKGRDSIIEQLNDQQERYETRVAAYERRLQAQFTAMETALSRLQSQQNAISGQLLALMG